MSAYVLLNLSNGSGEKIRCEALPNILSVCTTSLIKSIIQEYNYRIIFIICH